jgi:hypothetical protein
MEGAAVKGEGGNQKVVGNLVMSEETRLLKKQAEDFKAISDGDDSEGEEQGERTRPAVPSKIKGTQCKERQEASTPSVILVHYYLRSLETRVPMLQSAQPHSQCVDPATVSSSSSSRRRQMGEEERKIRKILEPCNLKEEEGDVMVALMQRAGEDGYDWRKNGANKSPEYLPANGCRKSLPVGKLACHQHDLLRRGGKMRADTGPSLSD